MAFVPFSSVRDITNSAFKVRHFRGIVLLSFANKLIEYPWLRDQPLINGAVTIEIDINHVISTETSLLERLFREEAGQDLIEYALVFSFVALGAIASMKSLSTSVAQVFAAVGTTLTTAT
jgi:Flp pilus assembly pilin Flp